jgi:hypothetical protein
MSIDVRKIIAEVQDEERARRDQDLANHHQANEKLQAMFEALNESIMRRAFGGPVVDRLENGVDILVKRIGDLVCTVNKQPGHDGGDIRVDMGRAGGPAEWFSDATLATKRVVRLLLEHQTTWPTREDLQHHRYGDGDGNRETA